MNKIPYSFEIPCKDGSIYVGEGFSTIEECVEECKKACIELEIDYGRRDVKLFMTDADGKWEVTEEGELAG